MRRSTATVILGAFALVLAFTVSFSEALGDVPALVNYQGRLLDSAGDPVADGPYLIKFIIYDAASAGNELYNSGYQTVQATDGLFDVRLGESPYPALPDTIFNTGADRWLGITVSTDPEITPRVRFTASGYAYQTLRADTAATAKAVEDDAVELSDIAQSGAAVDQVIKWDGANWVVADDDTGATGGDITAVTTSGGLGGGGTTGDVDVYINNDGVTTPKIMDDAVTESKIATGAVTEGKIATGAVTEGKIGSGAVTSTKIGTNAVGTTHINTDAVTTAKIVNDAVIESKILDGAVSAAKIATGAVTETKIATDAVTNTKIDDDAVTTSKIAANAVTSTKIGTNAVQSTHINTNAVTNSKIASDAVTETKIANDAVTRTKIQADAVDSSKIEDGTIHFDDIAQNGAVLNDIMKWNGMRWTPQADAVGSYGWSDDGTVVRLLTATDSVGIGTTAPRGKLDVTGDLFVTDRAIIGPGHTYSGGGAFVAGITNNVNGYATTIGGGENNWASFQYATVAGGDGNNALADAATVAGGRMNVAGNTLSTVAGGEQNNADADHAAITGGGFNVILPMSDYSFIGGGQNHMIEAHRYSVIPGGQENWMMGPMGGDYNVICGGLQNQMLDIVNYSTITGGSQCIISPGVDYSMLFGNQVDCMAPYQVMFYEATNFGALRLNCDDIDLPGPMPGPILVGTNPLNGNGAFLSFGGIWTPGSSREIKENNMLLDGKDVLDRIRQLQVDAWQYVGSTERHIWPYAEDFVELFDVGIMTPEGTRDNKHLAAGDIAGVALAGVQQLAKENEELRQLVRELTQRIEQLENR